MFEAIYQPIQSRCQLSPANECAIAQCTCSASSDILMKVHGSECDVLIQFVARVLYMYVRIYVDR